MNATGGGWPSNSGRNKRSPLHQQSQGKNLAPEVRKMLLYAIVDRLGEYGLPALKLKLLERTEYQNEAKKIHEFSTALDNFDWPLARQLAREIDTWYGQMEAEVVREQFYQALADGGSDIKLMEILREFNQLSRSKEDVRNMSQLLILDGGSNQRTEPRSASNRQKLVDDLIVSYWRSESDSYLPVRFVVDEALNFEKEIRRPPYRLAALTEKRLIVQCLSTLGFEDLAEEVARQLEIPFKSEQAVNLCKLVTAGKWKRAIDSIEKAQDLFLSQTDYMESVKQLMITACQDLMLRNKPQLAVALARHHLGETFRYELGAVLCGKVIDTDSQQCWNEISRHLQFELGMSHELPVEILKLLSSLEFYSDPTLLAMPTYGVENQLHKDDVSLDSLFMCREILHEDDEVWEAAFSDDGKHLAVGTKTGRLSIYRVGNEFHLIARYSAHSKGIQALQFSPCGRYIASGSADSTVSVWDLDHKKRLFYVQHHEEGISSLCWLRDGKHLVTGGLVGELAMWNLSGRCVWRFVRERILSLAPFGEDQLLALGVIKPHGRQLLFRFDSKNWEFVDEMVIDADSELTSLATAPDSPRVLANDRKRNKLILFDLDETLPNISITGPQHKEFKIMSSFGGMFAKYIVSGSEDSLVYLCSRSTRVAVGFKGHDALVNTVKWSPIDNLFASASDDHTVRIWVPRATV